MLNDPNGLCFWKGRLASVLPGVSVRRVSTSQRHPQAPAALGARGQRRSHPLARSAVRNLSWDRTDVLLWFDRRRRPPGRCVLPGYRRRTDGGNLARRSSTQLEETRRQAREVAHGRLVYLERRRYVLRTCRSQPPALIDESDRLDIARRVHRQQPVPAGRLLGVPKLRPDWGPSTSCSRSATCSVGST